MKLNIQLFADGKVVIETEIDTKGIDDGLKEIDSLIDKSNPKVVPKDTGKQLDEIKEKAMSVGEKLVSYVKDIGSKAKASMKETISELKAERPGWAFRDALKADDWGYSYLEQMDMLQNRIDELKSDMKKMNPESAEYEQAREKLEQMNNSMAGLITKQQELNDKGRETSNIFGKVIKTIGKWSLAIIGIRSVYNGIRKAISMVSSQSEQVAGQIKVMSTAVANTLTPLVQSIMNVIAKIMVYINTIFAKITGRALFDFDKAFKDANKNAKGTAKSISKMVAGFDEMNVLQDSSSSGGGGGISSNPFTALENIDIGATIGNLWKKMTEFFENTNWQELGTKTYEKLKEVFTNIDWGGIASAIFEGIGAVLGGLAGFIWGFFKKAIEDIAIYFAEWIMWAEESGGNFIDGLLAGIIMAFVNIGVWIWEHIFKPFIDGFKKAFGINSPSKVMQEMGGYIVDGLKQGVSNIWEKVKTIFENLKNKIIEAFTTAWTKVKNGATSVINWIKEKFEPIKQFFTNLISKITGAVSSGKTKVTETLTGVKNKFTETINKVIDGVNKLIRSLNKIKIDIPDWVPGIGGNKFGLSIPEIPRLAQGGIVNNPGRGVMMGNYIAGEDGAEAVLPLTDDTLQRLANMIPITVNLTNTMNGRVISRELQKVQNEQDFAYNR